MDTKTIKSVVGMGTQDATYSEILAINGHNLRVTIKSDSYEAQCYARIEGFDPVALKWNVMDSIPFSAMKTPSKLYYTVRPGGTVNAREFKADRDALVATACALLGI